METSRTVKRLTKAALLVLLIAACSNPGKPELDITEPPVTSSPSPTSTATRVPTPTATPVPTARPLMEPMEQEGIYRNETLGVSLEYPPMWDTLNVLDASDSTLLGLVNPEQPVLVFLDTMLLDHDQAIADYAKSYFDYLPEAFELGSIQWTTEDPDYSLGDGTPAWWAAGEGINRVSQGTVRYEILAVSRGTRAFVLTMYGKRTFFQSNEIALENLRLSLKIFPPHPYGVDRQDAFFLAASEPRTFDPAKLTGSAGSMIGDLFSGLVQLDVEMQPIPDLAERWEVSQDRATYTFYLRKNAFFHNGRPFTAADVKYSWERACDQETESNTALTYLGDIVGVPEVVRGEAEEISGVHVIDDYTLQVTIDAPKVFFLSKLAYPTSWIVDRETVEDIEETPIGTGPFHLVKHVEGEIVIMARHAKYHRGFVPLEYLVYLVNPGPAVRLYEAGEIDRVGIDEDLLDRAEDPSDPLHGTVQPYHRLCTSYVAFDTTRPPFDELNVRMAFAMAIDRERLNEIVNEGKGTIAKGIYPPGLPGYNPGVAPIPHDPEEARRVLRQSSYPTVKDLPEITFTTSGAGSDLYSRDALVLQMWEEVLGVSVKVEQLDSKTFYQEVISGNHGNLISLGWCADYLDPENFADVLFHSERQQNVGGYRDDELDAQLAAARSEEDIDTRISLYQDIEQHIVYDVPAIFLNHSRTWYIVQKPYVQGYVSSPIEVAQNMNIWIAHEK